MSGRLTGIDLPGLGIGTGLADWGRKTPAEMIQKYREYARRNKEVAEAILAAADDDFRIDTYVGPLAMKDYVVLQEGRGHG